MPQCPVAGDANAPIVAVHIPALTIRLSNNAEATAFYPPAEKLQNSSYGCKRIGLFGVYKAGSTYRSILATTITSTVGLCRPSKL